MTWSRALTPASTSASSSTPTTAGRPHNASAYALLHASKVHVEWAPSNQIFHAKYVVIDGRVAYIGTGNLETTDYSSTRDFWVEVTRARRRRAIAKTFDADFAHVDATSVGARTGVESRVDVGPGRTHRRGADTRCSWRTRRWIRRVSSRLWSARSSRRLREGRDDRVVVVDRGVGRPGSSGVHVRVLQFVPGLHPRQGDLRRLRRGRRHGVHRQRELLHLVTLVQPRTRRHHDDAKSRFARSRPP